MKTPTTPNSAPSFLHRLSAFLDLGALFLLVLTLCVRPLFPALAVGADVNILTTSLLLAASALVALRSVLLGRWPASLGWPPVILGAYTVLVFILAQFAAYRHAALLNSIDVASVFLLLFAGGALIRDLARARILLAALLATLLCVTLFGIYQRFALFPGWVANSEAHAQQLMQSGHLSPDMITSFYNRILSREVFSTFLLSNTFACYMLLLTPLAFAWAFIAFQRNNRVTSLVCLFCLYLIAFALYLTKSKGAWLAFPAAAVVTFLAFWKSWPVLLRRIVLGVLVVGLVAMGLLLVLRPLPEGVRGSVDVRLGYWDGAARLIRANPLFGVGPGNFHDAYIQVKLPEAEEVQHTHNGYLEVASETGLVGLLLWSAFWVFVVFRLRRPAQPALDMSPTPLPNRPVLFTVGAAGLIAFLFQAVLVAIPTMGQWLLVGFILVWTAIYALLTIKLPRETPKERFMILLALWAGIAVFLIHSFIDIDMSDAGITWTVMAMVVCAWRIAMPAQELSRPPDESEPRGRACPYVMFGAVLLAFASWWLIVIPIGKGATYLAQAEYYRGQNMRPEWMSELLKAGNACPGDERVPLTLGLLFAARFAQAPSQQDLDQAVKFYERAQRLRPLDERPPYYLARLYLQAGLDAKALDAIDRALIVYPTMPAMNRLRGAVLEKLGRGGEAVHSYRKALEYSAKSKQRERKFSEKDVEELQQKIEQLESKGEPVPAPSTSAQPPGIP